LRIAALLLKGLKKSVICETLKRWKPRRMGRRRTMFARSAAAAADAIAPLPVLHFYTLLSCIDDEL